jgi:hypothetical protein
MVRHRRIVAGLLTWANVGLLLVVMAESGGFRLLGVA